MTVIFDDSSMILKSITFFMIAGAFVDASII